MTNYEKLRRKPLLFRMFTGLSADEFDQLVADLEPVWLARKAKRSAGRRRQRQPGAGRKVKLAFTDRLLLVGPRRAPKGVGWRLLELLLLSGLVIALGVAMESRIGQRAPQRWEFYAAVLCLMLTFAFPGFVWRVLRRGADA